MAQKQYNNEQRIVLWVNEQTSPGKKNPYLKGYLTLDGKEYQVALWKTDNPEGKNNMPVLSGKVETKKPKVEPKGIEEVLPF